jgi:hypothetical protein
MEIQSWTTKNNITHFKYKTTRVLYKSKTLILSRVLKVRDGVLDWIYCTYTLISQLQVIQR